MAQVAVLMPVGPGERDVERAADTIESVVAHEPAVEWFVLIDDAGHDRQLSRRLEAHGRSLSVLANPRRGRGHGLLGGLCVGVLAGLAWIRESTTADVALRLDTDALAIAPFADKLARAFEETPDVGVLGSYDRTCNGAVRDFAPWEGPMGMLARRVRLHRHPGRRPYLGLALAGHQAQIRRHVLTALGNGYRPGEHCLAGAMAVSRELIERMASHGYLDDPLCWRALPCGDDPMIAMYARAAGMRLRGLVAEGEPFGIQYKGLPDTPQRLLDRAYGVVHSVKNDPNFSEEEIRRFFRERRERLHTGSRALNVAILVDEFPALSETFVALEAQVLQRQGHRVRVEATRRSSRANWAAADGLEVSFLEDDGRGRRLRDLAWLVTRHPLRCAGDLLERRRLRREERVRRLRTLAPQARRISNGAARHLHAHFAAGAALDAMRLGRLLGLPYSLTAHAYDIFLTPRNLQLKLQRASFATSGSDYTVGHLRRVAGPSHADRIHKVVMGVNLESFRRRTDYPSDRTVVGVGRLVEKKGFHILIEALSRLPEDTPARAVILGEGPARRPLEEAVSRRGLGGVVELPGAREPAAIREELERAALLAMPCVVAADGDRDGSPTVVKEALAMEIPVVASDEVGLPEIVRSDFGRLVPPGDAGALASAIAELLSLPAERRREMGRLGRAWVAAHANVGSETARLAELIHDAVGADR